jgi:hypothetical protein
MVERFWAYQYPPYGSVGMETAYAPVCGVVSRVPASQPLLLSKKVAT